LRLHWLRSHRQGKVRKDLHTALLSLSVSSKVDLPAAPLPSFSPPSIISTDVSVEQVALLAQQNTLPEPTLDLSLLSYSPPPPPSLSAAYTNNQQPSTAHNSSSGSAAAAATATAAVMQRSASISTSATVVAPPPDDPWMTGPRYAGAGVGATPFGVGGINGGGGGVAPPSSVSGTGLPSGWWKRQEKVTVQFSGQQGFVLNRYMVYGISTEVRRCPVLSFILFSLIVIVLVGVGGHHSVVARCIGDTPNSRSCGIVWFVDILSVYCRSCLPNELGVRDWNCLFVVWRYSSSTFSFLLADEMFLEQRRYDILYPSALAC
jgi:hypothetical protein